MTSRDFLLLALRILAFWGLIAAAPALGNVATVTFSLLYDSLHKREFFGNDGSMDVLVALLKLWIQPAVQITVAVSLWRWAPTIARAAYRGVVPKQRTVIEVIIDPNDAYRVGLRLLGGWAIFTAIPSLCRVLQSTFWRTYLAEGLLYVIGGLLLMIGPKRTLTGVKAMVTWRPEIDDDVAPEAPLKDAMSDSNAASVAPPASAVEPK